MTSFLTFDDVLIEPAYSNVMHRSEIDISREFLGKKFAYPIISANMNNVTEDGMALAMSAAGAFYVVHRFLSDEALYDIFDVLVMGGLERLSMSIGVRDPLAELNRVLQISKFGGGVLDRLVVTVDIAHGHHIRVADMVKRLKDAGVPYVIAGNVATVHGFRFLESAGVDAVKVGIGPGSVCTTREVTGVGVPQFSAIQRIAHSRRPLMGVALPQTPIIADGGVKNSGDIVKALAAGADMVMIGSLLAGTNEAPGERRVDKDGKIWRPYVGQSIFGTNRDMYTVEGVEGWVEEKGPAVEVLERLSGGIVSGLSYVGARNLAELREKALFIRVSNGASLENGTRVRLDEGF